MMMLVITPCAIAGLTLVGGLFAGVVYGFWRQYRKNNSNEPPTPHT